MAKGAPTSNGPSRRESSRFDDGSASVCGGWHVSCRLVSLNGGARYDVVLHSRLSVSRLFRPWRRHRSPPTLFYADVGGMITGAGFARLTKRTAPLPFAP